ncbi:MAG: hypothetical protein ACAI44_10620 [Candidatus Sericytochromatia bacterium]
MNKVRQGVWILLLGLWGCQPAGPTTQPKPSTSPSPGATASAAPSAKPTASPAATASPSVAPSTTPSPSPSVTPVPTPTPEISPTPSATPTPSAQPTLAPLEFDRIKVIAGEDPEDEDAELKSGIHAEDMLFPSQVSDLVADSQANLWFLNGSARILGYVTAEIVSPSTEEGDITYRLYWEKVKNIENRGGMVLDPSSGDFYLVQPFQNRVVRVNPETGKITPVAGNGQQSFNGDGEALATALNQPTDIARDSAGNFYITDTGNHLIRKLTPDGKLITIAGQYVLDTKVTDADDDGDLDDEVPTYQPIGETTGDGGPSRDARVEAPRHIAAAADGTVYFTSDSNTIRRIANDRIDLYAGSGIEGYNGDKLRADLIHFDEVGELQLGPDGLLYFVDNLRIRRVRPEGIDLIVEDMAGNGRSRELVDALSDPLKAEMQPGPLAFDQDGNLYVYDVAHRRLRMLERKNENS